MLCRFFDVFVVLDAYPETQYRNGVVRGEITYNYNHTNSTNYYQRYIIIITDLYIYLPNKKF